MSNRRRPIHQRERRRYKNRPGDVGIVNPIETPAEAEVAMTYAVSISGDAHDLAAARAICEDTLTVDLGERRASPVSFRQYDPHRRADAIELVTEHSAAERSKLVAYYSHNPDAWLVIGYANVKDAAP